MGDPIDPRGLEPGLDEILLRARIRNLLASPGVAGEVARDVSAQRCAARPAPIPASRSPETLANLARLAAHVPPARMPKQRV